MTRAARCRKPTGAWLPGPHLCWSERLRASSPQASLGRTPCTSERVPARSGLRRVCCCVSGRELPSPLHRQDEGIPAVRSPPCTVGAIGQPEKTASLVNQGVIRRHGLVPLASGCWHLASWRWSNWEGVELLGQQTPVIHPVHARHHRPPAGS